MSAVHIWHVRFTVGSHGSAGRPGGSSRSPGAPAPTAGGLGTASAGPPLTASDVRAAPPGRSPEEAGSFSPTPVLRRGRPCPSRSCHARCTPRGHRSSGCVCFPAASGVLRAGGPPPLRVSTPHLPGSTAGGGSEHTCHHGQWLGTVRTPIFRKIFLTSQNIVLQENENYADFLKTWGGFEHQAKDKTGEGTGAGAPRLWAPGAHPPSGPQARLRRGLSRDAEILHFSFKTSKGRRPR